MEATFAGPALGSSGNFLPALNHIKFNWFLEAGVRSDFGRFFDEFAGTSKRRQCLGDGPMNEAIAFLGPGLVEGVVAGNDDRVGEIAGVIDETTACKTPNKRTIWRDIFPRIEVADGDRRFRPPIDPKEG
jgi:hypothetical protein